MWVLDLVDYADRFVGHRCGELLRDACSHEVGKPGVVEVVAVDELQRGGPIELGIEIQQPDVVEEAGIPDLSHQRSLLGKPLEQWLQSRLESSPGPLKKFLRHRRVGRRMYRRRRLVPPRQPDLHGRLAGHDPLAVEPKILGLDEQKRSLRWDILPGEPPIVVCLLTPALGQRPNHDGCIGDGHVPLVDHGPVEL